MGSSAPHRKRASCEDWALDPERLMPTCPAFPKIHPRMLTQSRRAGGDSGGRQGTWSHMQNLGKGFISGSQAECGWHLVPGPTGSRALARFTSFVIGSKSDARQHTWISALSVMVMSPLTFLSIHFCDLQWSHWGGEVGPKLPGWGGGRSTSCTSY